MAWLSNTVHAAYGHLVRPARYVDGEAHQEAVKEKARTSYFEYLKEIDGLLSGRKWCIGSGSRKAMAKKTASRRSP